MEMERIWKLFIAQCEGDAPANHRVSKTPTMRLTYSKAKPARLGQNTSNQDYKKAFSFSMPTSKLMHTCADSHRAKSRFNKKKAKSWLRISFKFSLRKMFLLLFHYTAGGWGFSRSIENFSRGHAIALKQQMILVFVVSSICARSEWMKSRWRRRKWRINFFD